MVDLARLMGPATKLVQQTRGEGTLTLRRRRELRDSVTGQPIDLLALSEAAPAGAFSLTLHRPEAGSMRGTLPAGLSVLIAKANYQLVAAAEPSAGSLVVEISPPLAGALNVNSTVSLADSVELVYNCARGSLKRLPIPDTEIRMEDRSWVLFPTVEGGASPEVGDLVADAGTTVLGVYPIGQDDSPIGWRIHCGGRS